MVKTKYSIWYELLHLFGVIIATGIGYYYGNPILGTCLGSMFFIGREIAQAEYKWIQMFGNGKRANMSWYSFMNYKVWDTHSFFWNLLLPVLFSVGIVLYETKYYMNILNLYKNYIWQI